VFKCTLTCGFSAIRLCIVWSFHRKCRRFDRRFPLYIFASKTFGHACGKCHVQDLLEKNIISPSDSLLGCVIFLLVLLLQCCSLPLVWKLFCVLKQEGTNAYRRYYTKDIGVEDMLSVKKWPSAIRGGDGGRHWVWEREEGQACDCLLQRLAQLVLTTCTSASKQWEWDSRICNNEASIKKLLRIIGTRQVWPNCMWEMRAWWQWARNASLWCLWQRIPHVLSLPCPCDTACWRLVLPSLFSHCPCLWYAYFTLSVLVCLLQESWNSFSGILICHTSGRENL